MTHDATRYWMLKAELIELLGGKCVRCDSTDELEFDHRERHTKKFTIARNILVVSKELLLIEAHKCQLLCHACHMAKTVKERGQRLARGRHGTLSSYRYCKCQECRSAKSKWRRSYYETRGV